MAQLAWQEDPDLQVLETSNAASGSQGRMLQESRRQGSLIGPEECQAAGPVQPQPP